MRASDPSSSGPGLRQRLRQAVTSNLLWNTGRWGIAQGATFIVNVITARTLGQAAFGAYGILQTTLQTFAQVASFSTASTATKYVAEYAQVDPRRAGRIARICGLLVTVSGLAVGCAVILTAKPIATSVLGASDLGLQVALLGVGSFFTVSALFQGGVLAGLQRFDVLALTSAIAAPLFIAGGAGLAIRYGLTGSIVALVGNAALMWGLCTWLAIRERHRRGLRSGIVESFEEMPIVFRFALPGAITGLTAMPAIWVSSSILVRQPGGMREMAIFAASNSFRSIVLFLPGVLSGAALPSLNHARGRNEPGAFRSIYWSTLTLTLAVTTIACVVISVAGPLLMSIYGRDFTGGIPTLTILMASTAIEGTIGITVAAFQSTARMWTFLFAVALPRDVGLAVAAYFFAPRWGAEGLALAYATSTIVSAASLAYLTWRSGVLTGKWGPPPPGRT